MSSLHEAIIPRGARQGQSQLKRTCSIFAYEDIKEVHKRRYLLQVRRHPGHTRSDYMSLIEFFYFCFKAFSVNTKSSLCVSFQPMAVEVFSADGRNYLLAFQKGVRNKVYQRYGSQMTQKSPQPILISTFSYLYFIHLYFLS